MAELLQKILILHKKRWQKAKSYDIIYVLLAVM